MTLRPMLSRLLQLGLQGPETAALARAPAGKPFEAMPAARNEQQASSKLAVHQPAAASAPATEPQLIQTIHFGEDGNDAHYLGIGWGPGDRSRGLAGSASEIWLEHPGAGDHYVLELDIETDHSSLMAHGPRLWVAIRGVTLGRSAPRGRRPLRYYVPGEIVAGHGPIRISLQHEDAVPLGPGVVQKQPRQASLRCHKLQLWRTTDLPQTLHCEPGRGLAVADLARLSGMPADNLMCLFESLGDNCEFGTAQRLCGAEPLGLMRFGAPRLPRLLECLRTRFEHFGAIANLEFTLGGGPPRREYGIREKRYGMMYHTFQFQGDIDESTLVAKQAARLKLLVRKLLEDLEDGQKIFVWKDTTGEFSDSHAISLHAELATFAENTLLWVTLADEAHRPGSVEWMAPGLLKGYVHRFSNPVPDVDLPPWLEVCANAYLLVQAEKATEGGPARILPASASRPKSVALPLLPEPAVAHGMAHLQNRGDTHAGPDGWIGVPESGKAIEGLVILDDPAVPYAGLTYQVVFADGSLSEPASVSVFRGTRGKNQRLRGVLFTVTEDQAKSVRVRCEARFVDGVHLYDVAPGTVCQADSGSALEAFRLTLEPIS